MKLSHDRLVDDQVKQLEVGALKLLAKDWVNAPPDALLWLRHQSIPDCDVVPSNAEVRFEPLV